jgi:sterol desaturase/sphingolipid hydroxylase (fatty acid hydroxylase superfamily)
MLLISLAEFFLILFFFGCKINSANAVDLGRWSENFFYEAINRSLILVLISLFGSLMVIGQGISALNILIGIFALDFIFYWRHRFYHRYMMKFHQHHHTDKGFDLSVSLRIHPTEAIIHFFILIFAGRLFDFSVFDCFVISQIFSIQALVSHLNSQPSRPLLKRILGNVFVLPDFHYLHHCKSDYGFNYGFLFSFWDHLFQTAKSEEPLTHPIQAKII